MWEWTFTLPSELPFWELESRWTPEFSESNFRGQNPLDWRVPYIIGNILERKCLEWACMTHLDIWNISYGQKKGWESNWQFDSRPLKVGNRLDFLMCRWRATYRWKGLNEATTFFQNSFQSKVYIQSCGMPKLWESQLWQFRDSHLEILGQNAIWMWVLWRGTYYTIRENVVISPKSRPWWISWIWVACCSSYQQKCSNYALTTLCWFFAGPCE
jgi:hypothetical protein